MKRPSIRGNAAWAWAEPTIRVLLWAAAFWVVYRLQLRLEHFHVGRRELVLLLLASGLILLATWSSAPKRKPRAALSSAAESEDLAAKESEAAAGSRRYLSLALPLAVLAAALVLGVFFRVYDLNARPIGISFDEASNGLLARRILDGNRPPWFIGGNTQLPAAFFYIYALSAGVMGEGVLSLRVVSTIGGLAALPLLFLLTREIFDWRMAVLSTFILAVMRWHVNFSRFGVTNIYAATFVTGALAFFARGIRGGSRWNFVVAGVFVGLTPYAGFYGVFVPIVIGLYWLHTALFERVLTWRRQLLAIAIVAAAALVTYAPVGGWGLMNRDAYLSRPGTASILTNKSTSEAYHAVLKSTRKHALMFNSRGDKNGRHNLPPVPMLDRVTGMLFLLGLAIALARIRRSNHFLLLAWLAVFLQNGIWSVDFEAPQAFRSSAVTPAVAMLAALPLAGLWNIAANARLSRTEGSEPRANRFAVVPNWGVRAAATLTIAAVLTLIAYRNFDTYFNKQLDDPQVWRDFDTGIALVATELKDAGPDQKILLSSLFSSPVIDYVDDRTVDRTGYQLDLIRDIPIGEEKSALILLDATKGAYVDWIKQIYPDAQVAKFAPPGPNQATQAYKVDIPLASVRAIQGLQATYARPGAVDLTRREPDLNVDWSTEQPPMEFPFRARWSGTVRNPNAAGAPISVIAPGPIAVFIDDEEVVRGNNRVDVPTALYRGLHRIVIEADIQGPGRVVLQSGQQAVPSTQLFSGETIDRRRGLVATFYKGGDFSGQAILQELDPFVAYRYHAELAFTAPFSTVWQGKLIVDEPDNYLFRLEVTGEAALIVDGQRLIDFPGKTDGTITLRSGTHDIELRYKNLTGYAGIYLRWQATGEEFEVIPSQNLKP